MCGDTALPEGWAAHFDHEGRTFYANSKTGESTWTRPELLMLPEGWSAHQDAEGRTFYANALTGESSWTCPEIPSPTALQQAAAPLLPQGWSAHQDSEGRTFYANALTGESTWICPSAPMDLQHSSALSALLPTSSPPPVQKEFGNGRVNTAAAAADVTDVGTPAARLEERLMCGGFFQQINHFVERHAHKFDDPPTDGSGYPLDWYAIFREYEAMISRRCEYFLQCEGLTAEEVVTSMLAEEDQGKKFKSSEYLMAAINFEMFLSLMLDFKRGVKDVSRWWEVCAEEGSDWYAWVPAE